MTDTQKQINVTIPDASGRYGNYAEFKDPAFLKAMSQIAKQLDDQYGSFGHSYP